MILKLRLGFAISHLSYSSRTIPLLEKFSQPPVPFSLLNLQNPAAAPPLISRLFKAKPHTQLLQLYLNYIEKGEERPEGIAFQSIEGNLRRAVIRELQQKKIKITVDVFKAFQSELIEEIEFRGVFIHRNLNLNNSAYEIKPHSNGSATFQLKKTMRSDAVQEYERVIRAYSREKMDEVYCSGFDEFQRDKSIKRSIYRVLANISLTIDIAGVKQKLGGEPTEHILQVQSVFNRSYNMEEYFLTDVDFLLKGNYFLSGSPS